MLQALCWSAGQDQGYSTAFCGEESHASSLLEKEMIVSTFVIERLRLEHSVLPPYQLGVFCFLYYHIKLIHGLLFVSPLAINGLPVW